MKPVFLSILFCALFGSILCRVKDLEIKDMEVYYYLTLSFKDERLKSNVGEVVICYDKGSHAASDGFSNWNIRYTRSFGFWPFVRQVKLGTPLPLKFFDPAKDCIMAPVELPYAVAPYNGYKFQVVIKSPSWLPFTDQRSKWFKARRFKPFDSVAADVAGLLEIMTDYCADCLDSDALGCKTKMIGACNRVQNLFNQTKERCDACVATIKTGIDGARERCANACKSLKSIFAKTKKTPTATRPASQIEEEFLMEDVLETPQAHVDLKVETAARDEKRTKFLKDAGIEEEKFKDILALSQKVVSQYSIAELTSNINGFDKEFQAVGVKPSQMRGVKALLAYDSQRTLRDAPKRLTYPGYGA